MLLAQHLSEKVKTTNYTNTTFHGIASFES